MIKNILLLLSVIFITACEGNMIVGVGTQLTCGDPYALNYDYGTNGNYSHYTSECEYCEHLYYSEQARYQNCCCDPSAVNYNGDNSCYSIDFTYCL
jgi:hypothetical protein